jgi:uncharacterized membrane protein YcaP (DUF421 family)
MTDATFVYSGIEPLIRILVVGVGMYVALVLFLRISRSRTLSTMSAFDFVVTVAIGSAFGRALTAKDVAFTEALVAFALLVALQYVVTWIQIRWPLFRRLVTNPPALLYFRGEFVDEEMRRQRVTEAELLTAARKKNVGSLEAVEAIVLESSGEFSVITSVEDASEFSEPLDGTVEP